ncbi:hypothetical protein LTR27_011086 [Elasticomyces elasticus]|nr:hypothetical protein LTR27_011086 [Elasticomyces elasticus]
MLLKKIIKELAHEVNMKAGRISGDEIMDYVRLEMHPFGNMLLQYARGIASQAISNSNQRRSGQTCDVQSDEFLRALFACWDPPFNYPIWLVVACQSYMDIADILGGNLTCGADDLFECHQHTAKVVKQYIDFRKTFTGGCLEPFWLEDLAELSDEGVPFMEWMGSFGKLSLTQRAKILDQRLDETLPTKAMLELPVMHSHLLYNLKVDVLLNGLALCNDGLIVLAMVHFYAAAREYSLIDRPWVDMDFVIAQNSIERAFITPLNKNADAFAMAKRYHLALGVSLDKLRRPGLPNLPRPRRIFNQKGLRMLGPTTPFLQALIQHSDQEKKLGRSADSVIEVVLRSLTDTPSSNIKPIAKKTATSRSATPAQMFTPLQLLKTLKNHLMKDEEQLNFDYVTFFQRCAELMTAISAISLPLLARDTNVKSLQGYDRVDRLLQEAAVVTAADQPLTGTAFSQAARIVETYVTLKSDEFARTAHSQSSG